MVHIRDSDIPALMPRASGGSQFVFYGDCCSGIPGALHEANLAAVNRVVRRLRPVPEFVLFLGDHVFGLTDDYEALQNQWHHTFDAGSESIWREVFSTLRKAPLPMRR